MNQHSMLSLVAAGVIGLCATGIAAAQEKQHVSYKVTAENSKYTQQQFLDVGDSAGHQVRSFELHRTFPNGAPVFNGIKLKEIWGRGISDYIDSNGTATQYNVYVLENGDKFFTRTTVLAHSVGSGQFTNMSVGYITGGTGELAGIQGIIRSSGISNPKSNFNEVQTDIEYWISK
jgi:hypothetical protein